MTKAFLIVSSVVNVDTSGAENTVWNCAELIDA